ncbi:MAG: hypothetical protein J7K14_03750 [Sulfurimonas sp.]|nr:hypothetical protein [Sulfurimonas sp.]
MKTILLLVFFALMFSGCESKPNRPMVVSANLWIGYSPLYYAEKKGWLRESNIKLVRTVSLGESLELFNGGHSDMVCATQYEIQKIQNAQSELGSVILLDRSNGGDFVLSNRTVDELKSEQKINVYLEVESVNTLLLKYFMDKHTLKPSQMNMIDSSQALNARLSMKKEATIIVTYDPYNIKLIKRGYKEVGSTKDRELLVVDAIYAPTKTEKNFSKEMAELNRLVYKSLEVLKSNPKEYFEAINSYYGYDNYTAFEEATKLIEWIYSDHTVVFNKHNEMSQSKLPNLIEAFKDK